MTRNKQVNNEKFLAKQLHQLYYINIIKFFSSSTEEHGGLCIRSRRSCDMAHHEPLAEPQTLLRPQVAGPKKDQLYSK